jgi:HSP20 family protein
MVKKIKPIFRVVKIEAEINKIMGEVFFRKKELLGLDESWIPYIDISERENDVTVRVEIPGVEQKDVAIMLYNSRIEIKGMKKENLPRGKIKYHQLEREYGSFRRFIFLPSAIVPEKAQATLENGVLTIVLKKYKRKKEKEVILKIQKAQE